MSAHPAPLAVSVAVGLDRLPAAIRSATTLDRVDYVDHVAIVTADAARRSAEQWARTTIEQTPLARRAARRLWRALGLRLAPPDAHDHIGGWAIAGHGDRWVRLTTASWYMSGEAVFGVDRNEVSLTLFVRYDRPVAALLWPPVSAMHRRAAPALLRQAVDLVHGGGGR